MDIVVLILVILLVFFLAGGVVYPRGEGWPAPFGTLLYVLAFVVLLVVILKLLGVVL